MEKLEISKLNLTINLNNLPENIEFKDGEKSPRIEYAFFPNKIIIINNNKRKNHNTSSNCQKRAKNESY